MNENAAVTHPPPHAPRQFRQAVRIGLVIAMGLALHIPSLNMGFFGDDYFHQWVLRGIGESQTMRPWVLYDFGTFPADVDAPARQSGMFPWWMSPDWKARFFRPLTSLTLWADYAMFGDWATGYHLTSLAWYAGLLLLTYRLYRVIGLSPNVALLALALFAVADSCILPVAWPANRNSLLATFFTVASVLAASRITGRRPALALFAALALAILACLAKESGVMAFVLIAVYLRWAARLPDAPLPRRWANIATLACALLAGIYIVSYIAAGRGTNTVFYAMPWSDTGPFLARAAHLPFLAALSLLGLGTLDMALMVPHAAVMAIPVAIVLVGPFAYVLWKHTRTAPAARLALFWIVITLVPQAAAPLSDRLLFCASVGSSALLAMFVSTALRRRPRPVWRPRLSRVVAVLTLCSAGVLSGLSVLSQGFWLATETPKFRTVITSADVGPKTLGPRNVFVLQYPHPVAFLSLPTGWVIETGDYDVRFWAMQGQSRGLIWTRLDERTFQLETHDQPFVTGLFESVFVTPTCPATAKGTWQTPLFTVEAVEVKPDGLHSFRVRCNDSLDAPNYRFLITRDGELVAIPPPAVGQSIKIETYVPPSPFG